MNRQGKYLYRWPSRLICLIIAIIFIFQIVVAFTRDEIADEQAIRSRAIRMGKMEFNPRFFLWPGAPQKGDVIPHYLWGHLGHEFVGPGLRQLVLEKLPYLLSWPVYIVSLGGMIIACARKRKFEIAALVFAVIVLIITGSPRVFFYRYLIIILPVFLLGVGRLLEELVRRNNLSRCILTAGLICVSIYMAVEHFNGCLLDSRPPTARVATRWVEANIPSGSIVAHDGCLELESISRLLKNDPDIGPVFRRYAKKKILNRPQYITPFLFDFYIYPKDSLPLVTKEALWRRLIEKNVEYVAIGNDYIQRLEKPCVKVNHPGIYHARLQFIHMLEERATIIYEIKQSPQTRGKRIRIFDLGRDL